MYNYKWDILGAEQPSLHTHTESEVVIKLYLSERKEVLEYYIVQKRSVRNDSYLPLSSC